MLRIFCCTLFTFCCSLFTSWVCAGDVITVAGTGQSGNNGDAGRAVKLNIGQPFGVQIGPDGALYVTEVQNHRVIRVDLQSGGSRTVAGSGKKGYAGDGKPATEAELNEPYEVRFDADGTMYFVEMQNHLIRRVDAKTGVISTLAGTGEQGFAGDGGPATKAKFSQPHSISLDNTSGLYVADIGNHRVRRIDLNTGVVDTIAGNGERRLPHDGQRAAGNPLLGPRALFAAGNTLWIALREGHSIWNLDLTSGVLHHVAGTGEKGYGGDNGAAKLATFNGPKGIAVGPDGAVFVVDTENQAIRRIDPQAGAISTIAGGPSANVQLARPHGVCVGTDGSVYIGDTENHCVRRVAP